MKTIKVTKVAKDLKITHSAVSQWFSGKTKPTIDKVILMNDLHKIPFTAWRDIKSYISNSNNTPKKVLLKEDNENTKVTHG